MVYDVGLVLVWSINYRCQPMPGNGGQTRSSLMNLTTSLANMVTKHNIYLGDLPYSLSLNNDPLLVKEYSISFLPASPSFRSRTFEGFFELTRHPASALNLSL